jgi:DNA-binding MarR family transcriptional regulator
MPGQRQLRRLDETFASATRLRICAYLTGCEEADFKAVMEYCGLSQSNLSKNLTTLNEHGYVDIIKVTTGRYAKTRLRLTEAGRSALDSHVAALQEIVTTARTATGHRDGGPRA